MNGNLKLDTILFADDLAILTDSEGKLQCSVCNLQKLAEDFNVKYQLKNKVMASGGKYTTRSKICMHSKVMEQVVLNMSIVSYVKMREIRLKKIRILTEQWE
jgi:hypothetical protein